MRNISLGKKSEKSSMYQFIDWKILWTMELHVIDHFYLENVFFNTPENTLTPPRIHMSHPCDHKCGNHMKCFMANMYSCWLLLAVFPISGLDFRFRLSWFSLCFLQLRTCLHVFLRLFTGSADGSSSSSRFLENWQTWWFSEGRFGGYPFHRQIPIARYVSVF